MSVYTFFALQITAHLLTDYFLQTNKKAEEKNALGFKSPFLKYHCLIAFLTSWILSFQLSFIIPAMIIALTHGIVDGFKPELIKKHQHLTPYTFFIEQAAHLTIITITVIVFFKITPITPLVKLDEAENYIILTTVCLLCLKPTNSFIKELFIAFNVKMPDTEKGLQNAGRLIGILERLLTVILIISNQFEAVGFLMAAKSILRYKETDTGKTEYVLIGTMVSFGIAVSLGMLYNGMTPMLK